MELKNSRFDRLRTLIGRNDSDKILLLRRHKHLIKPLENNEANMRRWFTNGTVTRFILVGCFFAGYSYAKLQSDEVLRRNFYCRYANFITHFDDWSPIFERIMAQTALWLQNFDSTYAFWHFRTSKLAEFRAYKKLEGQIFEKEAYSGDEVSRAILEVEK